MNLFADCIENFIPELHPTVPLKDNISPFRLWCGDKRTNMSIYVKTGRCRLIDQPFTPLIDVGQERDQADQIFCQCSWTLQSFLVNQSIQLGLQQTPGGEQQVRMKPNQLVISKF